MARVNVFSFNCDINLIENFDDLFFKDATIALLSLNHQFLYCFFYNIVEEHGIELQHLHLQLAITKCLLFLFLFWFHTVTIWLQHLSYYDHLSVHQTLLTLELCLRSLITSIIFPSFLTLLVWYSCCVKTIQLTLTTENKQASKLTNHQSKLRNNT